MLILRHRVRYDYERLGFLSYGIYLVAIHKLYISTKTYKRELCTDNLAQVVDIINSLFTHTEVLPTANCTCLSLLIAYHLCPSPPISGHLHPSPPISNHLHPSLTTPSIYILYPSLPSLTIYSHPTPSLPISLSIPHTSLCISTHLYSPSLSISTISTHLCPSPSIPH